MTTTAVTNALGWTDLPLGKRPDGRWALRARS